jgi:hypothetical protein
MSGYRLPKLQKDKDVLIQSRYAVKTVENAAYLLTNLSCEASNNKMISMSCVLTDVAEELLASSDKLDVLTRWMERKREQEENDG